MYITDHLSHLPKVLVTRFARQRATKLNDSLPGLVADRFAALAFVTYPFGVVTFPPFLQLAGGHVDWSVKIGRYLFALGVRKRRQLDPDR